MPIKPFTYVLFELATRPEYVQPLRDEIEAVTKEEGWSEDSFRKLWKVDSFIKESVRTSTFMHCRCPTSVASAFRLILDIPANILRKALTDFTFSNGITMPAGAIVTVPACALHFDPVRTLYLLFHSVYNFPS